MRWKHWFPGEQALIIESNSDNCSSIIKPEILGTKKKIGTEGMGVTSVQEKVLEKYF